MREFKDKKYPHLPMSANEGIFFFFTPFVVKCLQRAGIRGCVKMPSFHSLDADDADNADKL